MTSTPSSSPVSSSGRSGSSPGEAPAPDFAVCRVEAISDWSASASLAFGISEKVDGERCLLRFDGQSLSASNRRGQRTPTYPEAARSLTALGHAFLVDGVRMREQYVLFDLLMWRGMDLRTWPFHQRIALLSEMCLEAGLIREMIPCPTLGEARANSQVEGLAVLYPQTGSRLAALLQRVQEQAGEGIIIRAMNAAYSAQEAVLKYQFTQELDAFVIGIKPGRGGGSLLLGLRRPTDQEVIAIGHLHSGLTQGDRETVSSRLHLGQTPVLRVSYLPARSIGIALVEARSRRSWIREDKSAWECTTDQLGEAKAEGIRRAIPVATLHFPAPGASPIRVGATIALPPEKATSAPRQAVLQQEPREPEYPRRGEEQVTSSSAPRMSGNHLSTAGRLVPIRVEKQEEYAHLEALLQMEATILVDVRRPSRSLRQDMPALSPQALRATWGMKYLCLSNAFGNTYKHRQGTGSREFLRPTSGIATLALLFQEGLQVVLLLHAHRCDVDGSLPQQVQVIVSLLEEQQGISVALLAPQEARGEVLVPDYQG